MVIDQLRMIGVNVELGFEFYGIEGPDCNGIRFRKKADNYEELDDLIKKKKIEIQVKLQEMGSRLPDELDSGSDSDDGKVSPQQEIEMLEQQQWI